MKVSVGRFLSSGLFLFSLGLSLFIPPAAQSQIAPPFHQCPTVGVDSGCAILIVVTDSGISVATDPAQGPFDQIEDTLIGVQNNSTKVVRSLPLSAAIPIFGFDGDGLCLFINCTWPHPTNYEGQTSSGEGISFSDTNPTGTAGIVHFGTNGIKPSESVFFSLEESIQTLCQPLSVQPKLKQFLGTWAALTYDHAPDWAAPGAKTTISAWGCNLTSAVMLINYQAQQQHINFVTTPTDLDSWLNVNSTPYIKSGSVYGYDIQKYVKERTNGALQVFYQGPSDGRDDFALDNFLCTNNPVILQVPNGVTKSGKPKTHFVLATGQITVGSVNTFAINDPGYNENDLSGKYGFQYVSLRKYSSTPTSPQALLITAHSPVELLVTDPLGKRTGFDTSSAVKFNEIIGSTYYTESIGDDDNPASDNTSPEVKNVEISSPLTGTYSLKVQGIGAGPYTIDFYAHDSSGDAHLTTVQGSAISGSIAEFAADYSPTPGSPIVVRRVVTIGSVIADVTAARNAKLLEKELAAELIEKLNKAGDSLSGGRTNKAVSVLGELLEEIREEHGDDIKSAARALLTDDLSALITALGGSPKEH